MTLNKLHKLLGKLIEQGHGRREVCVDKPTFRDNRESDGCVILDVTGVQVLTYYRLDDDGSIALAKDGSERMITGVVLYGSSGPTPAEGGS